LTVLRCDDLWGRGSARAVLSGILPKSSTVTPIRTHRRLHTGFCIMPSAVRIHQIFYDAQSRAQLDPGFLALDNSANLRPDWREFWPIRQFMVSTPLSSHAAYGFFSPKFRQKTGLDAAEVHRFIAEEDADVFLFSPFFDESATTVNLLEQAEVHHPGTRVLFTETVARMAPRIDVQRLVMDARQVVFCNYFVARPAFWQRWFDLCDAVFRLCEVGGDSLAARLSAPVPHGGASNPAKVFLIERVASLILATEPQWKVRAYDSSVLPLANGSMKRFITELKRLDALKRAWNVEKDPEHLRRFHDLRHSIRLLRGGRRTGDREVSTVLEHGQRVEKRDR
jgi:hypothetical protein